MVGLIGKAVEKTCRYGHGPLHREEGQYGLPAFLHRSGPSNALLRQLQAADYQITNRVFVLSLWRCPTCGYVELFDEVN